MKIGIIGVGNISGIYLQNLSRSSLIEIVTLSDLDMEKAKIAAARYQIPNVCDKEALLSDPAIELILNLTTPQSHVPIALEAVRHGKHVYGEKPLGLNLQAAKSLLIEAEQASVEVGCAPDTFLGAAHQTCREIIDEGQIGAVVGVHGFMMCGGHESWHPSPEFYYQKGGGPMLDMGPYYLTAMVNMFGSVTEVKSFSKKTHATRTISSEPKSGKRFTVETETHIDTIFRFESDVIGHLTTSFDVPVCGMPSIVVYGSSGTLIVPDPNGFGSHPKIKLKSDKEWKDITSEKPYSENCRGLGLIEFIQAIENHRKPLANGKLAFHVLEIMLAASENKECSYHLESRIERPAKLSMHDYFDQPASDWDN